ncbi:hypothetical protein EJB05_31981, partial [Eragrostis curvula]
MAGAATSRDVEEVIQKLHSDRARTRDEGVKLLGTWLQGDRAVSFCRLLGRNTVRLKPGHLTGAATWPLLILALLNCVKEDISAKKRGATKSAAARMLRVAVQCAEDVRLSGHSLLLISVARQLFSHIWEVIKDGPGFQLEFSIILRQLLAVKEYRYQMKSRTYSSFVILYMKRIASGFDAKSSNQASSKDESFRCALTLHVLLENPPGDYPDIMREEILIQDFVFRSWLRTHDQTLKSLFITYAKVQLKLARAIPEVLQKLVDIIIKELDQNVNTGAGFLWCEAPRDEKAGFFRCFQEEWMDLSATVFYLAYKCTPKIPNREKRLKTEHIMDLIMDGLLKGTGSICFLIHKYGHTVEKSLMISWFKASCQALRSDINRALKEFSIVLMLNAKEEAQFCLTKGEMSIVEGCWQDVWNSLIQALPLFSTTTLLADSALSLLGGMIVRGDLSNSIFIRKNLLRSALELEFSLLNEQNVVIIPEVIFSLCAGFSSPAINSADASQL